MAFIPETTINRVIERSEVSDFSLESEIEQMASEQPMLLAYLTHDQFDALTQAEQSLLLYLSWVIYKSVTSIALPQVEITEELLGGAEEANWELYLTHSSRDFRSQLDPFFEDASQEDLLAFIEDSLTDDDDETITEEGRGLLFVGLKTVMDAMTQ